MTDRMKARDLNYGDRFRFNHMVWTVCFPHRHTRGMVEARTRLESGQWWVAGIDPDADVELTKEEETI